MNCPFAPYDKNLPKTFSEWNNICQNCDNFEVCAGQIKKPKKDKKEQPTGDNYPVYNQIHLRMLLNKERKTIIEKFMREGLEVINDDDKMDVKIDIGLYEIKCRKDKIKHHYLRRKKSE
jgi:hypothetical protein